MRIAVTGANGFIGQHLCPFLYRHHAVELVTLTRSPSVTPNDSLSFEATDHELALKLNNIDCIIHLAGRAHCSNAVTQDFERDNQALCQRITRLCVAAKIPRLIYISSIKANGNSTQGRTPFTADEQPLPSDIYGKSKLACEEILKKNLAQSATQLVIIRPPLVYGAHNKGNLKSLDKLIRLGIPLPVGNLNNQRDLISIENLCSFISIALTHQQAADQTYLVSDGIARNTKEIIYLLAKLNGRKAKVFAIPNWAFKVLGLFMPETVDRLTGDLQVDITKAKSQLGWSPQC